LGALLLVKTNMLANLSRRPGLVTMGLCTVAATASMLGAVVALMLTGLVPEAGRPMAATAYETASPDAIAGLDPATEPASVAPDEQISPAARPVLASAAASAALPATAAIDEAAVAVPATAGVTPRPPLDHLPLDLGPRVAHALAALEPSGFLVLAGSFVSERHAAALAETIAVVAAPVKLTPFVDAEGRGGWLVSAGPFADAATATGTAADIRRLVGVDPQIRALERGE
jgi:hypothetical protein